ncbi:hypothetical protein IKS57_00625, partial [bacterium]|nr:hypothetical protein [bacterium]
ASEIASNINIDLPASVSLSDDENAQIPNVSLTYNGIDLTPKSATQSQQDSTSTSSSSTTSFTITGFSSVTANQIGTNNNRNTQIANILDSILSQKIEISGFSNTTAADAIKNDGSQLETAIINAIEDEIVNSKKAFIIDAITYKLTEIDSGLKVTYLPSSIS